MEFSLKVLNSFFAIVQISEVFRAAMRSELISLINVATIHFRIIQDPNLI